mmetsp:Transcript_22450/g.40493  ORF Transcript_22450/g.40493 Transcript_22450/m.40493 type:complete len:986 (-) Transcript_22450:45-3002(-)
MSGGKTNEYGHALLFICISLLIVVGVYQLRKLIKVPASLLLVLSGLFLRYCGVYIGQLEGAVGLWQRVDEWSMLLFFLPALIFECGFSIDWYTFKRELPQILLMSSTAVIAHTYLVTVALKYLLQYDLTWNEAFLIGVMLSATDHVTVVSQIKEMKVGLKFETLIQGETLLIDGSVMVLFFVILKKLTGEDVTDSETTVHFFRLCFGGVLLGVGFCAAFAYAIRRIINDEITEVNMTILTTYLIFFTAEDSGIEVSGAISTVTFALFMAAYGKTLISPAVEKSLHIFWRIISRDLEGLIFVMSGIVLGQISLSTDTVTVSEVWKTFVVFILLHLIRGLVVLMHFPLLSRLGLGLHWKDAVILSFAGAKGVISSSLSILIWHNTELNSNFRELALFIVVICSSLSMFLDSFIVMIVMKYLGMGKISEAEEYSLLQVTQTIVDNNQKLVKQLTREFPLARWETAESIAGTKSLVNKVMSQTERGRELLKPEYSQLSQNEQIELYFNSIDFIDTKLTQEIRRRCLTTLRGLYWEHFEKGLVLGPNALKLMESANCCLENISEPAKDWAFLFKHSFHTSVMNILLRLSKGCMFQKLFRYLHFVYLADAYDITHAFVEVHELAVEAMEKMMKYIQPAIVNQIIEEFQEQIVLAREYLELHIHDSFNEVISYMQTKQVSYCMLNNQRQIIHEYYNKGLISIYEMTFMMEEVDRNFMRLTLSHNPKIPKFKDLLRKNKVFEGLPKEDAKKLIKLCTPVTINSSAHIFELNSHCKGFYLILKGKAEESSLNWSSQFISGESLGELNLLPDLERTLTSAIAVTPLLAAFLPKSPEVLSLVSEDCLKTLAVKLLTCIGNKLDERLIDLMLKHYWKISRSSFVRRYTKGCKVSIASGGFLIYGELESEDKEALYFSPENIELNVSKNAAFMHFDTDLTLALMMADGKMKRALMSMQFTPGKAFEINPETETDDKTLFSEYSDRTLLSDRTLNISQV